ncbi:hypothetical protein [Neobacillus drentensis]|uniref:hypothetical protein n=1 Tax=Neobacillus drentensis TaxID=220684 RepID=UPI0008255E3B|nr:hypothetical protein [Neobacillus drentensis]
MKKKIFIDSKPIVLIGIMGLLVSLIFLLVIFIHGRYVLPDGDLTKPLSFNAAIGLFIINLAVFLNLANFSEKGRKLWVWWTAVVFGLAMVFESVQPLRGVDPRFAHNHNVYDIIIGKFLMSSLSVIMMVLTIIFMIKIFKSKHTRNILLFAIKWSASSLILAFIAGLIMIALLSRHLGENGNFIWSHGFAFHALQIIPLLGWFLENEKGKKAKTIISITSVMWNIIVVLLSIQAFLNQSLFHGIIFYINLLLGIIITTIIGYAWFLWKAKSRKLPFETSLSN